MLVTNIKIKNIKALIIFMTFSACESSDKSDFWSQRDQELFVKSCTDVGTSIV